MRVHTHTHTHTHTPAPWDQEPCLFCLPFYPLCLGQCLDIIKTQEEFIELMYLVNFVDEGSRSLKGLNNFTTMPLLEGRRTSMRVCVRLVGPTAPALPACLLPVRKHGESPFNQTKAFIALHANEQLFCFNKHVHLKTAAWLHLESDLSISFLSSSSFFFFCHTPRHVGILVPQPRIELTPPAVEARRLNHWTSKDVSDLST